MGTDRYGRFWCSCGPPFEQPSVDIGFAKSQELAHRQIWQSVTVPLPSQRVDGFGSDLKIGSSLLFGPKRFGYINCGNCRWKLRLLLGHKTLRVFISECLGLLPWLLAAFNKVARLPYPVHMPCKVSVHAQWGDILAEFRTVPCMAFSSSVLRTPVSMAAEQGGVGVSRHNLPCISLNRCAWCPKGRKRSEAGLIGSRRWYAGLKYCQVSNFWIAPAWTRTRNQQIMSLTLHH